MQTFCKKKEEINPLFYKSFRKVSLLLQISVLKRLQLLKMVLTIGMLIYATKRTIGSAEPNLL